MQRIVVGIFEDDVVLAPARDPWVSQRPQILVVMLRGQVPQGALVHCPHSLSALQHRVRNHIARTGRQRRHYCLDIMRALGVDVRLEAPAGGCRYHRAVSYSRIVLAAPSSPAERELYRSV